MSAVNLNFLDIFRALWEVAGRTGPGVFWRFFLGGFFGFILSVIFFLLWYKFVFRKGWLAVHQCVDRVVAWLMVPLTALSILTLTVISGFVIGAASAISFIIVNEHLGEQASKLALKGMATAVIVMQRSSQGKAMSSDERVAFANRLLKGEESIPIESLKAITPRNLAELSADKTLIYVPTADNRVVRAIAVKMTEYSITWLIYAAADDRTDLIYKTVVALSDQDRKTDGNGKVTVDEIAAVLSRLHVEKAIVKIIVEAGLLKAGFLMITLIPIIALPPLFALLLRGLIRYVEERKKAGTGAKSGDS